VVAAPSSNWKDSRWALGLFRIGVLLFQGAVSLFCRVPGPHYFRFMGLDYLAVQALEDGKLERAARLAEELLVVAQRYRPNWNYGNALHQAHLVLGRVALARGNITKACEELLKAADVRGSPQLKTYGPNMRLALELFRRGERDTLLKYFERCRIFWQMGGAQLARWSADVKAGRTPDFAANLEY
jgi:tetratricopeptide (TPR) repeat protein